MTAHFLIRQRFTLASNRYEIWRSSPQWDMVEQLAFAQQKRMALREEVPFYADDSKSHVRFSLKARNVMDVSATVDVRDENGAVIGGFQKDFGQSLLISTWHLSQPGLPRATGKETSMAYALVRRVGFDLVPYNFLFTLDDGTPVMSVVRKIGVRDTYQVTVEDPRFDTRLLLAMATGLDMLQAR